MIKDEYVQKLADKYKKNRKVPPILSRIFFHVLATAIEKHYGHPRGDKCLQFSYGTHHLLKRIGIESKLLQVEVRAIHSKVDPFGNYRSGGFEGENHHIICFSNFGELIDFSIHFLNLHPATRDPQNALNPPALWWSGDDPAILQPALCYHPIGAIKLELPRSELDDLESYIVTVGEVFETTKQIFTISELENRPLLNNFDDFIELANSGKNSWVNEAVVLLTS